MPECLVMFYAISLIEIIAALHKVCGIAILLLQCSIIVCRRGSFMEAFLPVTSWLETAESTSILESGCAYLIFICSGPVRLGSQKDREMDGREKGYG